MNTPHLPVAVFSVLLGLIVLTSGRRLFWLFVGVIGFATGYQYSPHLFNFQSETLQLILAICIGFGGALLAVFFQKVAIGIVGFAAGGYIAMLLLELLGLELGSAPWLPYVVGGIVGVILLFSVFNWALIAISSFAGAGIVIHAVTLPPPAETPVFLGLAIFGLVIQAKMLRRRPSSS